MHLSFVPHGYHCCCLLSLFHIPTFTRIPTYTHTLMNSLARRRNRASEYSRAMVNRAKQWMPHRKFSWRRRQSTTAVAVSTAWFSLSFPITLNIKFDGGTLKPYQVNLVLVGVLLSLLLLFFGCYQLGRVIGLVEVVLYGLDGCIRVLFLAATKILRL